MSTCRKPYNSEDGFSRKDAFYVKRASHSKKDIVNSAKHATTPTTPHYSETSGHAHKLSPYQDIADIVTAMHAYVVKETPYRGLCLPEPLYLLIDGENFLFIDTSNQLRI